MRDRFLVVTVDTEQDCDARWQARSPFSFRSVAVGIGERLQPACEAMGVLPTYLLSPSVMEDRSSVEVLRTFVGRAELGTHLHGELIEPSRTMFGDRPQQTADLQCCYGDDLQRRKLEALTKLFEEVFACRPTSFRAGRFAADAMTLTILGELGYVADSSVTPHVRWRHAECDIDFRTAPEQPYRPSKEGICRVGDMPVLEVPVTILAHGSLPTRLGHVRRLIGSGTALRMRVGRPLWFRPSFATTEELIALIDHLLAGCSESQPIVLNMMFHSVELTGGTSPYAADEHSAKGLVQRVVSTMDYAQRCGFESTTLSRLADVYGVVGPWK
jgi:hypothetical protein